ncbi:MAG: cytochrome c-type biogenesis protein CcmH [Gammaproteobacteria bacterium]|nr:cytochrome c-type biogenesis protein CcmH [Gammaproteobacteria bacterium]
MRYIALLMLLITVPALAVDSEPALPNATLQQRYETLTHQFRCLVCQNETIAESNAGLAADLRTQVREQLIAGKSDEQIKQYMVARYGDFVLFKPPWQPNTWLLWAGPLLLLGIGALVVITVVRRKSQLAKSSPGEADGDDLRP